MKRNRQTTINDLQNELLIRIISLLDSTEEAIRTGILCKRWRPLWPYAENLIFEFSMKPQEWDFEKIKEYISFVAETLTKCGNSKLNKFRLHMPYNVYFESQVTDLIRHAFKFEIKKFEISLEREETDFAPPFDFATFFFSYKHFTHLELGGCLLTKVGSVSWSQLKSLDISDGLLDEVTIQNVLSGCPLLESLGLTWCSGYNKLDITSKSVKRLVFTGYEPFVWSDNNDDEEDEDGDQDTLTDSIEINAPHILSLTIQSRLFMSKLSLLNVSSLVEANLNYRKFGNDATNTKEREEMFEGFMLKLCNVKELTIGQYCQEELTRLKARGGIIPSNVKYLGSSEEVESGDDGDDSD